MQQIITSLTQEELKGLILSAFAEFEFTKTNLEDQENKIKYLTIQDVCEKLHISKGTLHNLLNNGAIESIKVGRRRLFTEDNIKNMKTGGTNE